MSRLAQTLLQPGQGYGAGKQAPMVDLQYGGQMGYAPDLTEWVSNQSYIRKNVIPLLVEAPKAFSLLRDPNTLIGSLRAMVELHAMSVDGLQMGLEVETVETPVGGAGEMQEDFVDVKRTRSQVTFRWNEKIGMPIFSLHDVWIRMLMMDPNTKFAGIAALGARPEDMLADQYSATMCFIEPDPSHTRVMKAWLGTNMFPKGTGEVVGRRDITQAGEQTSYDIQYSGIYQVGAGVDAFAQTLLDSISLTGANPQNRQAFVDAISADVASMRTGYNQNVANLAANSLPT